LFFLKSCEINKLHLTTLVKPSSGRTISFILFINPLGLTLRELCKKSKLDPGNWFYSGRASRRWRNYYPENL